MKSLGLYITNFTLFFLLTLLLCSIQSSFLFQLFSTKISPLLWIPTLIFWNIYKSPRQALFMTYTISAVVVSFSQSDVLGEVLLVHTVIYGLSLYANKHLQGSGILFFVLISGLAASAFPLLHSLTLFILEDKSVFSFQFFDWIIQALFTALTSFFLFPLFKSVDQWTQQKTMEMHQA